MKSIGNYLSRVAVVVIVISFSSVDAIMGQSLGEQLNTQLEGKTTFKEIMSVVEPFYSNLSEAQRNSGNDGLVKYKQWKRWEWYVSRHLGPNGEFVNIAQHNLKLLDERGSSRAPSRQSIIEGQWSSVGMFDAILGTPLSGTRGNGIGRIDRIAFHPTDENTFYVGSPCGGLWKTDDAGATWNPLMDTLASLGVSGIAVTPSNPDKIFVLTGSGDDYVGSYNQYMNVAPCLGVMVSEDGGENWNFTDTFPSYPSYNFVGYDLAQNSVNQNLLLAATSTGVFRTNNGGNSWAKVLAGNYCDVVFKPGSSTIVYAASSSFVKYSVDGGITWLTSSLDIPPAIGPDRIALGVSPENPSVVYAFFGNPGVESQFAGVYKSTNSGITFQRKGTTPNIIGDQYNGGGKGSQSWYDLCIAVHPENSNAVNLGALNNWYSTDGCAVYHINTYHTEMSNLPYVHTDIHAVAYNPLNNKLYICGDGGVWVQENFGDTCISIFKGLVVAQFFHMSQSYDYSYRLAGGTQDNGIRYRPSGTDIYTLLVGGDGFSTSFMAGNPNKLFATSGAASVIVNIETGKVTLLGSTDTLAFKEILAHPTDSNIVFIGAENIWKSTNKGVSFTNVGGKGLWALAIAPSDPTRMYAAGGVNWWYDPTGVMYTSTNSGNNWIPVSYNEGFPALIGPVTDISVDPLDPLTVYFTMGGVFDHNKIYRSTDGGANWTNISYNLPNVACLSIVATTESIYIGTDISVYHLMKDGTVWTDVGSNIPHAGITDLTYDHNSGILTASTYGRGLWQRSVCIDDITLTYPLRGSLQYSCDDQLQSSSEIQGFNTDSINFRANGKINLTPGFNAKTGAYFKAEIEPCDQGNIPLKVPPIDNTTSVTQLPKSEGVKKQKGD